MSPAAVDTSARALKRLTWPDIDWSARKKPIVIVDGHLHALAEMRAPVHGTAAYVVGVNEKSFLPLCESLRVQVLHLYEVRVSDLRPLCLLAELRGLAVRWNTRARDIEALGGLSSLQGLVLEDTPKIRDLAPLARLRGLSSIEFSGGIWNRNTASSLEPLAQLTSLRDLTLLNLRVESGGLRPLARCRSLETLELSNQFATEDYAYLSVHLPNARCPHFAPYIRLKQPVDGKDIMVVGRRKPFLNSRRDQKRLERYASAFAKLQREAGHDADQP